MPLKVQSFSAFSENVGRQNPLMATVLSFSPVKYIKGYVIIKGRLADMLCPLFIPCYSILLFDFIQFRDIYTQTRQQCF